MDHNSSQPPPLVSTIGQRIPDPDSSPLRDDEENIELTDLRWIRDLILQFKQGAPKDQIKDLENWLETLANSEPDFNKGSQLPFLNTVSFAVLVDYEILGRFSESLCKEETISIAFELFQRIMNGYKGVFGFDYFQAILKNLGIPSNSFSTNDYTQATVITADIRNALLSQSVIGIGSNPPFVLTFTIQYQIGKIFMRQNKLHEAVLILKDVHRKRSASLGLYHLESILVEIEIASCFCQLKQEVKAFELLKSIYKMLDTFHGSTHEKTIQVQLDIVRILVKWEKAEEALVVTNNVVSKMESTLGIGHVDTLRGQEILEYIHAMIGDSDRALNCFIDVHKKRKNLLGLSHPETVKAHCIMAEILDHQECYAEALHEYKILYPLQEATLGPDHENTFKTLCRTAICYQELDKTEEALDLYTKIFEKQKTAEGLGPCHQETLATQINVALLLAQSEKFQAAVDLFDDFYEKKKVALGEDHYDTVQAKRILAVWTRQMAALEIGEPLLCSICLVQIDFVDKEARFPGECSHKFHLHCLIDWTMKGESKTCPECRSPISFDNIA